MFISFLIKREFLVHRILCLTVHFGFACIGAALLAVTLAVVSCTKETADEQSGLFASTKTCNVHVTLKTGLGNEVDVKAHNSWHDRTNILNVWVIQLSEDGKRQLCEPKYVTSFKNVGGGYTFEARLVEANAIVIFLANTGNNGLLPATGNTLSSIQQLNYSGAVNKNGVICSSGQWSGEVSRQKLITATLRRTSALLDLTIDTNDLPEEYTVTLTGIQVLGSPMSYFYLFKDGVTPYPTVDMCNFGRTTALDGSVTADITKTRWEKTIDIMPNARGKGTAATPSKKNAASCPTGEADRCSKLEVYFQLSTKTNTFSETEKVTIYLGQNATNDFNIYPGDNIKLTLKIKGFKKNDVRITASNRNTIYENYPLRWSKVTDAPSLVYDCRDQKPAIVAQIYFNARLRSNKIKLIYINDHEVEGSAGIQTPRYEYIRPVLQLFELAQNGTPYDHGSTKWNAQNDETRELSDHINTSYYLAGERLEEMKENTGWMQCGAVVVTTREKPGAPVNPRGTTLRGLAVACCRKDHNHDGYYTQMRQVGAISGYVVDNRTGQQRPWGFEGQDHGPSVVEVPTIE